MLIASESILGRAASAPKRTLHSTHTGERTERRIIIDATMLGYMKLLGTPTI